MEAINLTINNINNLKEYDNKPVRLSGIAKNATIAPKYLNNTYKYHWIYTFRYIGTDEFISFEFDYFDKFVGVMKNK